MLLHGGDEKIRRKSDGENTKTAKEKGQNKGQNTK
jgi:hypothetical protein